MIPCSLLPPKDNYSEVVDPGQKLCFDWEANASYCVSPLAKKNTGYLVLHDFFVLQDLQISGPRSA